MPRGKEFVLTRKSEYRGSFTLFVPWEKNSKPRKGNKVTDVGGGERDWFSAFGEALECRRGRGTPQEARGGRSRWSTLREEGKHFKGIRDLAAAQQSISKVIAVG